MNVRGERECGSCGTRWSYYETGSVACPSCGGLRSVGVDERAMHTDAPVDLDLASHRDRFGDAAGTLPRTGVDDLRSDLREYCRRRGFINAGRLRPLDETYLAARELLEAIDCFDRLRDPVDADREYVLALLAGADDGVRPPADRVSRALREARGMAAVRAVEAYRADALSVFAELDSLAGAADDGDPTIDDDGSAGVVTVAGDAPAARVAPARNALERLRERAKRADALDGDVSAATADALVDAANAVGEFVRTGDERALARAERALDARAGEEVE
mgnify:CR=1 FL=1